MKKLFRFHRGGLFESLATTIEVSGIDDILDRVKESDSNICGIEIKANGIKDSRLPKDWEEDINTYIVTASRWNGTNFCVGMCNFYEI